MDDNGLSPDDVAAFLDGRLQGDELARVHAYLAEHPVARQEVIKASRIVSTVPARRKRSIGRWVYPLAGLAAAAVLFIAIKPPFARVIERVSTERRPSLDQPDRIEIISPLAGQQLRSDTATFTWGSVNGANYHFSITDEAGVQLYQYQTTDTVVKVTGSQVGGATGRLYWSVDAQIDNGSSVASVKTEVTRLR
jgi:hypothetical protein